MAALIVLCWLSVGRAHAAFLDTFGGARALGRGGANVAVADDTDSLVSNPAGLTNIGRGRKTQIVSATYAGLFLGLSDGNRLTQSHLAYAIAAGEQNGLGIAWKRTQAGRLYSEDRLVLGLARRFRVRTASSDEPGRLALGINAELLKWDTAPTLGAAGNIVEDLSGPLRFDISVGGIYWLSASESVQVPVGLVFQHITRPDVASSASAEEDPLPVQALLGIGAIGRRTLWALDIRMSQHNVDVRSGVEWAAEPDVLFLRAGLRLEGLALGTNLTFGAGFHLSPSTRADYAFWLPIGNVSETLGSHRFTFLYRF